MLGNKITLPTWRWLGVNGTDLKLPDLQFEEYKLLKSSKKRHGNELEKKIKSYPSGFSLEDKDTMDVFINHENYIECDKKNNEIIKLNYKLNKDNSNLVDRQTIYAKEDSSIEVFYDYTNEDEEEGFRYTDLRLVAERNAKIKVYIVQRHNEKTLSVQAVTSIVEENAEVDIVEIEAGAYQTYFNYRASLVGDKAKSNTNAIYFGYKEEGINLFYNFDQIGKSTDSNVIVKGALKDNAHKMFKASLDFKKGSKGSIGNEEEYVTLLSENVHSVAVPLLLCNEEDVVGNHASSAGRIDNDILFYIMSRGIDKKEAEKMIIESNFMPIINLLPFEEIKDKVWEKIESKINN